MLMVGLQGSGKTTTAAKLALHLRKQGHRSLLIAADTRRPAAMDQLEALGKQLDVPVYREEAGPDDAPRVAANGLKRAREMGVAWAIVDTGGRLHVDDALMEELVVMKAALDPAEVLLVVDAMTGQDAVNAAAAFNERIGLTGLVLSKLDGDSRGGAALSATQVTGVPVKFAGISEQLDGLEVFHPERMASRILGMGDIVTLVERVQEQTTEEEAAEMERKLRRAQFDLDDFLKQLRALQKMGPLSSLLEMLPGAGKMRAQLPPGGVDERRVRRIEAIISSMTMWERQHPERINGSRRRRVAQGSGTTPSDINQLLAQFREMQKMLKQLASGRPNALGALAEHPQAAVQGVVNHLDRIGEQRADRGFDLPQQIDDLFGVGRCLVKDVLEERTVITIQRVNFFPEGLVVAIISEPDALTRDLVGVGGADAPSRRADLARPPDLLVRQVHELVVRRNEVGIFGKMKTRAHLNPSGLQRFDFLLQDDRIDHQTVADHALNARVEHAGGNEVQDRLFIVDDDRVAGIVPALITRHEIGLARDHIDDLPLALVAPLASNNNHQRHCGIAPLASSPAWYKPWQDRDPCRGRATFFGSELIVGSGKMR
ncbi:signal recognition particle protein, partial [Candidatus Sumerlaeota bacterium]|nr:signal recognition particle protein [Candidatus Sumerlaeota bacterium]